jgi:hypothetical protein
LGGLVGHDAGMSFVDQIGWPEFFILSVIAVLLFGNRLPVIVSRRLRIQDYAWMAAAVLTVFIFFAVAKLIVGL